MPHYEESTVVRVFRVRGIICELSACGSRFTLLLSTLFFVMAGSVYVRSFDLAPIALSDKVLVHIVLPRCEVISIQLLARESAPHLSIHCDSFFFSLRMRAM